MKPYLCRVEGGYNKVTNYQKYKKRWSVCNGCDLCKTRYSVVLWRGVLPCQVLFIGEAPGPSEDIVGRPFVGQAGSLLNNINHDAWEASGVPEIRFAITNILACYPGRKENGDFNKPTKDQATACRPRLIEFVQLAEPDAIVTLGQISRTYFPQEVCGSIPVTSICHPSHILREESTVTREIQYARCVNTITRVFKGLPHAKKGPHKKKANY